MPPPATKVPGRSSSGTRPTGGVPLRPGVGGSAPTVPLRPAPGGVARPAVGVAAAPTAGLSGQRMGAAPLGGPSRFSGLGPAPGAAAAPIVRGATRPAGGASKTTATLAADPVVAGATASGSTRPGSAGSVAAAKKQDMGQSLAALRARLQQEREQRDATLDGSGVPSRQSSSVITPPSTAPTSDAAADGADTPPVQTEGMSAEAKAILGRIADFDLMGGAPEVSPATPAPPASPPPKGRSPQPRKGRTVAETAGEATVSLNVDDDEEPRIVDLPERERPPQMVTFGTSSDVTAAVAAAPPTKRKMAEPIACGDDTPLPVDGPPPNSQPLTAPSAGRTSATTASSAAMPRRATAASAVGGNNDDVRDTEGDTVVHGSIVRPRGAGDVPFNPPQGWDDPNASSIRQRNGGTRTEVPVDATVSGATGSASSVKPMARPISKAFAARLSVTTRSATQPGLYFDHIMEQVAAIMQEAA